jgi:hypothetical protein
MDGWIDRSMYRQIGIQIYMQLRPQTHPAFRCWRQEAENEDPPNVEDIQAMT